MIPSIVISHHCRDAYFATESSRAKSFILPKKIPSALWKTLSASAILVDTFVCTSQDFVL